MACPTRYRTSGSAAAQATCSRRPLAIATPSLGTAPWLGRTPYRPQHAAATCASATVKGQKLPNRFAGPVTQARPGIHARCFSGSCRHGCLQRRFPIVAASMQTSVRRVNASTPSHPYASQVVRVHREADLAGRDGRRRCARGAARDALRRSHIDWHVLRRSHQAAPTRVRSLRWRNDLSESQSSRSSAAANATPLLLNEMEQEGKQRLP